MRQKIFSENLSKNWGFFGPQAVVCVFSMSQKCIFFGLAGIFECFFNCRCLTRSLFGIIYLAKSYIWRENTLRHHQNPRIKVLGHFLIRKNVYFAKVAADSVKGSFFARLK